MAEQLTFTGDPSEWAERMADWFQAQLFNRAALLQALTALAVIALAYMLARALRLHRLSGGAQGGEAHIWDSDPKLSALMQALSRSAWMAVAGVALLVLDGAARHFRAPHQVLSIAVAAALGWVVAHAASALIRSRFLGRAAGFLVWSVAVLHALNLMEPAQEFLDDLGFAVGKSQVSLLLLLKGGVLLAVLLQLARLFSGLIEDRLHKADGLSPSAQVLFSKGARFSFFALAFAITLGSVGVDLTSLTVFSGAVGVGVGFGLQKIFSNLVSGVILLLDKSLKPGDIIEVDHVQGKIAQINARYAAVETPDGKAYLIPNENLIGNNVINLSYNNSRVLLKVSVGVAYRHGPRAPMALMEQAACGVPRVLAEPAPKAFLSAFGDSSIELDLCFWIEDPQNGTGNVKSAVLLAVWDAFQASGIEIPYPQQEVRMLRGET